MSRVLLGILLSISFIANAQYHEFSFGVGASNYYGDLSPLDSKASIVEPLTSISTQNIHMSYTGEYRYNFKNRFSVGFGLTHMYVGAYDSDNTPDQEAFSRKIRNLSFNSVINEANLNLRFEPFRNEDNWNQDNFHLSPYIGLGIGIFKFNPTTMYKGQEYDLQPLGTEGQGLPGEKAKYSLTQFSIPFTVGFKVTSPNRKVAMSIDLAYRWTTTDYLDDVSTVYVNPAKINAFYSPSEAALINALAQRRQEIDPSGTYSYATNPGEIRGNSNHNDSYVSAQVKFSFFLPSNSGSSSDCYNIK